MITVPREAMCLRLEANILLLLLRFNTEKPKELKHITSQERTCCLFETENPDEERLQSCKAQSAHWESLLTERQQVSLSITVRRNCGSKEAFPGHYKAVIQTALANYTGAHST